MLGTQQRRQAADKRLFVGDVALPRMLDLVPQLLLVL